MKQAQLGEVITSDNGILALRKTDKLNHYHIVQKRTDGEYHLAEIIITVDNDIVKVSDCVLTQVNEEYTDLVFDVYYEIDSRVEKNKPDEKGDYNINFYIPGQRNNGVLVAGHCSVEEDRPQGIELTSPFNWREFQAVNKALETFTAKLNRDKLNKREEVQ